jgi:hypothetical protein
VHLLCISIVPLSTMLLCFIHLGPIGIPIPYIHGYEVLEDPIVSVHHYTQRITYVPAGGPYGGPHAHTVIHCATYFFLVLRNDTMVCTMDPSGPRYRATPDLWI